MDAHGRPWTVMELGEIPENTRWRCACVTVGVPSYFKSYAAHGVTYAMSGPEKIRSRGLWSHIVSKAILFPRLLMLSRQNYGILCL